MPTEEQLVLLRKLRNDYFRYYYRLYPEKRPKTKYRYKPRSTRTPEELQKIREADRSNYIKRKEKKCQTSKQYYKENQYAIRQRRKEKSRHTWQQFYWTKSIVTTKKGIPSCVFKQWVISHIPEIEENFRLAEENDDPGYLPTIIWRDKWDLSTARVGQQRERHKLPKPKVIPPERLGDPITDPSTGKTSYFFSSEDEVKRWQEVHPGEPVPFPV